MTRIVDINDDSGAIVAADWFAKAERVHRQLRTTLPAKYEAKMKRVFAGGARKVGTGLWAWGDRTIIDGIMVNGTARLIGWFAGVARRAQMLERMTAPPVVLSRLSASEQRELVRILSRLLAADLPAPATQPAPADGRTPAGSSVSP